MSQVKVQVRAERACGALQELCATWYSCVSSVPSIIFVPSPLSLPSDLPRRRPSPLHPLIAADRLSSACTFLGPSRKRGPPKGYIDAIEARLHQTEALIGILLASKDTRAKTLLEDLSQVCATVMSSGFLLHYGIALWQETMSISRHPYAAGSVSTVRVVAPCLQGGTGVYAIRCSPCLTGFFLRIISRRTSSNVSIILLTVLRVAKGVRRHQAAPGPRPRTRKRGKPRHLSPLSKPFVVPPGCIFDERY